MVVIADGYDEYKERMKKGKHYARNFVLKVGLMSILVSGTLDYGICAFQTRELNPSRIIEYYQLKNKIFYGKSPLADANHDGKVSFIEEAILKEEE